MVGGTSTPISPPQKAGWSTVEGLFMSPCSPAGRCLSPQRSAAGAARAVRMRGQRSGVPRAEETAAAPPPTWATSRTAQRLPPMKAAGRDVKILRRRSCTCLFSNRAGLSELTKPGRQRRLEQLAASAVQTPSGAGRAVPSTPSRGPRAAKCASPSGPRAMPRKIPTLLVPFPVGNWHPDFSHLS